MRTRADAHIRAHTRAHARAALHLHKLEQVQVHVERPDQAEPLVRVPRVHRVQRQMACRTSVTRHTVRVGMRAMFSERSSSSVGAPPACIGAVRVRARTHKRTGVGRLAAREMELALHIHCYDILICLMNNERMEWTFKHVEHVR